MTRHLGLDLGGTNLKWAVVERADGEVRTLARSAVPTRTDRGSAGVVEQLAEVGKAAIQQVGGVASAGVGIPGMIDPVAGVTHLIPNIPGDWVEVSVARPVGVALAVPTHLINDARAFTLAELLLGAGRGARTMLGITLGTGIGGGVVIDGRLYLGHDGTAGEFGHQTILPDGPRCGCGNLGCLEVLTQAAAIAAVCGQATVEEAVMATQQGDERARAGLEQVGRYLGIGVSNAVVLLTPDRVVFGGGVAAAGSLLLDPIRAEMRRRLHITDVDRIQLVTAQLGSWAGAIGAALYGAEPIIETAATGGDAPYLPLRNPRRGRSARPRSATP
jgi:glucokinase